MLQGIDRVVIRVPSVDAAVAYYRDVLNMRLVRRDATLAAFAIPPDSELILHNSEDLPAMGVYFRVDDVAELHRRRQDLRLRFLTAPRDVTRGRLGVVKDPFGTVLMLLDRTHETASAAAIETGAASTGALFAGVEPRISPKRPELIDVYTRIGRTADDLPYTHHFESLYDQYKVHFDPQPSREEVWRHILNLRKAGSLPKLGKARSTPPPATDAERNLLRALLGDAIGKRDRLPYSRPFDDIVEGFNSATRKRLTPHQIWRLIATLAK